MLVKNIARKVYRGNPIVRQFSLFCMRLEAINNGRVGKKWRSKQAIVPPSQAIPSLDCGPTKREIDINLVLSNFA